MTLQHIQSVLETNVLNVSQNCSFVKNDIFVCKKSHAHLKYACNICAKVQVECVKILRGADYTILLPLTDT